MIQVLEQPGTYSVSKRSLYYETHADRGKDKHFLDNEIEWHSTSIDTIIPLRLLVRILPQNAQTFAQKNSLRLQLSIPRSNEVIQSGVKLSGKTGSDKSQILNLYLSIPVYSGELGLELVREEPFTKLKGCIKNNEVCLRWYTCITNCVNVVDYVLTNCIRSDGLEKGISLEDPQYGVLGFCLPWCSEQNRILFYFKSLLNSRHVEWSPNEKIWKVPSIHIYTVAKFVQYLGGSIDPSVESHVAAYISKLKGKAVNAYEELCSTGVWKYTHILLASKNKYQQLNFSFYPFDKRIVELAKSCKMKWNQNGNLWEMQLVQLPQLISHLKRSFETILPHGKLDAIAAQFGVKIHKTNSSISKHTLNYVSVDKVANSTRNTIKRER